MEAFDLEMERLSKSLTDVVFDPPSIRSMNDIVRIVQELDPKKSGKPVEISTTLALEKGDDSKATAESTFSAVLAPQDKRSVLLRGATLIRDSLNVSVIEQRSISVNNRTMKLSKQVPISIKWFNDLAMRLMGAKLDGAMFYWDINNTRYYYNIFDHVLWRDSK